MKKLPIGIQYFPKLIRNNYHYVDKTQLIWQMITAGEGYFLSRPRRFGKSLLTSTLKAFFRGERNLFEGLWIASAPHDWHPVPVIHLDFSEVYAHTTEMLQQSLNSRLKDIALEHDLLFEPNSYPAESFIQLIRKLNRGNGVVVLIDEYDKPIISHLHDHTLLASNHDVLKDFFGVIKSSGEHLNFVLITGVSKFSKVSLFSGMNNLVDISLDQKFATLLGITEEELDLHYGEYINQTARSRAQPIEDVRALMRQWYNGYQFGRSEATQKVYNPVSLHLFLTHNQLSNYWFGTATPTFALELIKNQNYAVPNFEKELSIGLILEESHEVDKIDLLTLLYQTGYLTISSFQEESLTYKLKFPNEEVSLSFYDHLLHSFTAMLPTLLNPYLHAMKEAIINRDLDTFFGTINQLLSEIPYPLHVQKEAYYHSLIFLLLRSMALQVSAEVLTRHGRLDLALSHLDNLFLFEFKMDSSAQGVLMKEI